MKKECRVCSLMECVECGGRHVECNVCSVWFSFVVFSMLDVKCNVGRFVPNVRCGVCSVKCRVCSLMECVECRGRHVEHLRAGVATGGWSVHL